MFLPTARQVADNSGPRSGDEGTDPLGPAELVGGKGEAVGAQRLET